MNIAFSAVGNPSRKPFQLTGVVDNPFAVSGEWLRGETHFHPAGWEDVVLELYADLGFDFIVRDKSPNLTDGRGLLTVPGYEIKLCLAGGFLAHLVTLGAAEAITSEKADQAPADILTDLIQAVHAQGGLAVLAHPIYSGWRWAEMEQLCLSGLDGIEVLNGGCLHDKGDCGRADQIWQQLLHTGRPLIATGAGDVKKGSRHRAGRAWTGVLAKGRTADDVLDALRAGRTYASEGPMFTAAAITEQGRLTVHCSPCAACHLLPARGGFKGATAKPADGADTAEEFVFDLANLTWQQNSTGGIDRPNEGLIAVLETAEHTKAWLSPIYLDLQSKL